MLVSNFRQKQLFQGNWFLSKMCDHTTLLACEIKLALGLVFVALKAKVVGLMARNSITLIGQSPLGISCQFGRGALTADRPFQHDGHSVANGFQFGQQM